MWIQYLKTVQNSKSQLSSFRMAGGCTKHWLQAPGHKPCGPHVTGTTCHVGFWDTLSLQPPGHMSPLLPSHCCSTSNADPGLVCQQHSYGTPLAFCCLAPETVAAAATAGAMFGVTARSMGWKLDSRGLVVKTGLKIQCYGRM